MRAPGSGFSRRRLLQVGGAAALTLSLARAASWVLGEAAGGHDNHYRRRVGLVRPCVLSVKELAVLGALCDRLLATAAPTAAQVRVAERIDSELRFHVPKFQSDVKAALALIEHGGLLHGSAERFTLLSPYAQDVRLRKMTAGLEVERAAVGELKAMAFFFYYSDERTWSGIHYAGPMIPKPSPPEADSALPKEQLGG